METVVAALAVATGVAYSGRTVSEITTERTASGTDVPCPLASRYVKRSDATPLITGWAPPPGRVRLLRGIKGSTIIDDTYNSSPSSALAALDILKQAGTGKRRIAVLGDMLELGKYSHEAHRPVGERAAKCADMLITVGFRARAMAEAALDAGMKEKSIRQYELNEAGRAGKELEAELREGDLVLVKGSQGIRMERTVLEIMAEPQRAAELLVRMEQDWLTR